MIAHVFPHLRREDVAAPAVRTAELRALTVRQPWAACIASGAKTVENRTWPTRYRGPLAIHAASAWDPAATRAGLGRHPAPVMNTYFRAPVALNAVSAILAVAQLTGCHEYAPGCCETPWAEKGAGVWHWTLADVRALAEPVECAGRLSVWRPKPEIVAAVLAQIGGAS